jgi:hypothetical protein
MAALQVTAEPHPPALITALTAVPPVAWTSFLVAAFCRVVLGKTSTDARRLTFVHQAVVWGGALVFVWFAVGGWTPILQAVGL